VESLGRRSDEISQIALVDAESGAVQVLADLKTAQTFRGSDNFGQRILGGSAPDMVARNEAIALVDSISGGAFAAAGVFASRAVVNGAVRAKLDGNVTSSASVLVKGKGGSLADSRTLAVSASGVAGMGISAQYAEVGSSADVEATSTDGNNDQQITSSGHVEFAAESDNEAKVHTDVAAGGALAGIAVSVPTARVSGATTASVEGNVTAGAAGINVHATSGNNAIIEILAISVGALSAAVTWGEAEISTSADTEAKVLANATFSAPAGAVEVFATSINHTSSSAASAAVGALAVNVMKSVATVAGATLASFNGDIATTLTKTASLTVKARGQNQATVDAFIAAISLSLSGGVNLAQAHVTSDAETAAEILSSASINVSGAVTVDAGLTTDTVTSDVIGGFTVARSAHYQNYALANLGNVAGGAIAVGATVSDALVDAGTRATLNGDVTGSGSITVKAHGDENVNAPARNDASAKTLFVAVGLAGLAYTDTTAQVGVNAVVKAEVGSAATVASSGLISVTSRSANNAITSTNGGAFGLVAGSDTLPRAKVRGSTIANFGGNATSANGMTVTDSGVSMTMSSAGGE